MLPAYARLKKEQDFNLVWRKGRSYFSRYLLLKMLKKKIKYTRFGIIVSNKVSKKATQRNRLKRRIREILRLKLDKITPGHDCVIVVKAGILERTYQEIDREIKNILLKAGLIR